MLCYTLKGHLSTSRSFICHISKETSSSSVIFIFGKIPCIEWVLFDLKINKNQSHKTIPGTKDDYEQVMMMMLRVRSVANGLNTRECLECPCNFHQKQGKLYIKNFSN